MTHVESFPLFLIMLFSIFFCMTIISIYILYTLSYIGVLSDKRTLILYFHLRYFFNNFSSNQRKEWGEELRRIVSRDHAYVLVTCEQLVGVCMFVFIRPHLVPFIR